MRLIILENNLRERLGHFLNSTIGLANAARHSGQIHDVRTYCNKSATKEVCKLTSAVPQFRHLSWQRAKYRSPAASMQKFGGIYAEECRQTGDLAADDIIMVPTAQENQVYGLALFLATLPDENRPWIVLNFHVDNWTAFPMRSAAIRDAFRLLHEVNSGKVLVTAPTPELVDKLSGVCGNVPARLYPLPQNYDLSQSGSTQDKRSNEATIAVMGRPIKRKGSADVAVVIRKLKQKALKTRFLIQCNILSPSLPGMLFARNVNVKVGGLSPRQYGNTMNAADIILMPYSVDAYKDRTSGVFADCAALGKVAVVPADTWMAQNIIDGHAAGTIYQPGAESNLVGAVVQAIENLGTLRTSAKFRSHYWWESQSAGAYIEKLAGEFGRNLLPIVSQPISSSEILTDSAIRQAVNS